MHPYLRHNILKRAVPALRPRVVTVDRTQSIVDHILANVWRKSQEYPAGNVYETLIPRLTRQVMAGLWAYDLTEIEPTQQPNCGFIQHLSRHLYGQRTHVARIAEEIVVSMNNHLVNQLYNLADEPPFTGDLIDRIRRCAVYPDPWCLLSSTAWHRLRFDDRQTVASLDGITIYHHQWLPDDAPALVGNRHSAVYRLHLPVVASQIFPIEGHSIITFASQVTLLQRDDDCKRLPL